MTKTKLPTAIVKGDKMTLRKAKKANKKIVDEYDKKMGTGKKQGSKL